jgi:hypothetical protein
LHPKRWNRNGSLEDQEVVRGFPRELYHG